MIRKWEVYSLPNPTLNEKGSQRVREEKLAFTGEGPGKRRRNASSKKYDSSPSL